MSNLEAKAREIAVILSGSTFSDPDGGDFRDKAARLILHALREERERAAKKADEYERRSRAAYEKIKDIADGTGLLAAANQALDIAAAIRGDDNG